MDSTLHLDLLYTWIYYTAQWKNTKVKIFLRYYIGYCQLDKPVLKKYSHPFFNVEDAACSVCYWIIFSWWVQNSRVKILCCWTVGVICATACPILIQYLYSALLNTQLNTYFDTWSSLQSGLRYNHLVRHEHSADPGSTLQSAVDNHQTWS